MIQASHILVKPTAVWTMIRNWNVINCVADILKTILIIRPPLYDGPIDVQKVSE